MKVKVFLSLFLMTLLIIPVFADSYIITPSENQILSNGIMSISSAINITCNPIYGTNSCSGELTENEKQNLINKGYKIYPNLKVHAFLNESVPQIKADHVWNITVNGTNLTGKGQTVCIIDTGIDYNHSALGGGWGNKVIAGWRFLGSDIQECNDTNHTACWDDNGHGTHVAGIVASNNTTYRGVAPDVKLVVVKALDDSGGGYEDDAIKGINYCIYHAEEYNISVISMSLGITDGENNEIFWNNGSYCDEIENLSLFKSAINNATAKNISVVVASGNKGNTTDITAPACLFNATPVGSVNSEDIKSNYNYWSLPIIFAPGELIYSSVPNYSVYNPPGPREPINSSTGWKDLSGTSMATPHVAGVFALMNQYLKLSNKTKTPQELEDIAIATGINVTENHNNSRIDSYEFYLNLSANNNHSFGSQSENVSGCMNLNQSGETYYLNQSIWNSTETACINISADNITFDCQGYTIDGNDTDNTYGIYIYRNSSTNTNITIKNCTITDWEDGIYFKNASGNIFQNIISVSSQYGIYFISSSSNKLENLSLINNSFFDFYTEVKTDSDCNNELINVSGTDNKPIVYYNDTVDLKNWDNNASQIILCNADNSTIDNITLNHTFKNNGFLVLNTDNSSFSNMSLNNLELGLAIISSVNNAFDNITTNNNEEFGMSLVNSSNNNFANIISNLNNFTGIFLFASNHNNKFYNISVISNKWDGITLISSNYNTLNKIKSNCNNETGIILWDSNFTVLANSTIQNNSGYGISIFSSKNNLIYNNLFNNTNNTVFAGANYTNYWNTTKQTGTRIYSNGIQIGGNYYTNPNGTGYSDTCLDYNADNFCDEQYNITDNNTDYLPLSISTAYLNLIPSWNNSYTYTGNKTLSARETENENRTRNLFINLNQTRTLSFLINNSGDSLLYNLTQINSTNLTNTANSSLALNFTAITIPDNISAGGTGYLNITIEPPADSSYFGNYSGWIYLNSSNGEPHNYLNLTLNITVTNQTLLRLNKTNKVYYFEDNNLTQINFSVYFYDNITTDALWNTSANYNLSLVNSTNNSQILQNLNFSIDSSGLFSANINSTNMTEGNYTLLGNITDEAGNIVEINSSFELLHNLELIIATTPDLNSIVKGYPFDFTVNVSKPGNFTAENITVRLDWTGTGLNHSNSSNRTSVGNINGTNSGLALWNFTGIEKKNYTINVNVYSKDGRFNYTKQQKVVVRYGTLTIIWVNEPPSEIDKDSTFKVKARINNTGNLNVTGVLVNISFSTTYFTKTSGDDLSCNDCDSIPAGSSCESCYWYLKPIKAGDDNEIKITATGNNATDYTKSKEVDINTPSSDDDSSSDDSGTTTTYYGISFLKPTSSSFYIVQGGTYDLEVELKNTGNAKLNDLYLELTGINSSYYSITPSVKDDLNSGSTQEYTIHFSIPDDYEAKDYDLILKAISDEKTKTKPITLTVKQKDLQIYEITDFNITHGESRTLIFYIKNTGEVTLHNVYPALAGISGELFKINSSDTINLSEDEIKYYTIKFTIPKTDTLGTKELKLTIASDELNISQSFYLTILPCEEEISTINDNYEELVAQLKVILNKLEKAKKENKNTSSIASEIESANLTLTQIEKYISSGNYAEAKNLITNLNTELNSMSSEFENLKTTNSSSALLMITVVVFSIILIGIVVAYTFLPKKGYVPGKGYTMTSKKNELEQSIRNIFKKLGANRSVEEKLRKKKLTEWKKWYKQQTKKRKY